jgi:hypothetical protein
MATKNPAAGNQKNENLSITPRRYLKGIDMKNFDVTKIPFMAFCIVFSFALGLLNIPAIQNGNIVGYIGLIACWIIGLCGALIIYFLN